MSYAIFDIFYGVPLTPSKRAVAARVLAKSDPEAADLPDDELDAFGYLAEVVDRINGFHTRYSGHASDIPMAFGVRLSEFDECKHDINVSSLKLVATDEIKAEYKALYDSLDAAHQTVVDTFGEPHVFFLTSTS